MKFEKYFEKLKELEWIKLRKYKVIWLLLECCFYFDNDYYSLDFYKGFYLNKIEIVIC